MIPVRLTLKNFMSYGEEGGLLPLEGLHVACLSGDNGNGKSALLDAMTWALWGRTRASATKSVSDDDLIRVGASDMAVALEFDLSGERYRVSRKRKRGRAGGDWTLAHRLEDGTFVSIGSGGHRDTERQIVQLLNMEYDTFINSAYLQQGRADEFARQTPDNRKRILGEILGLDRFERLEARARELYRSRREEAEDVERQIRMLDSEIGELPQHTEHLRQLRTEIAALEPALLAQEASVETLRARRGELDKVSALCHELEAGCKRIEGEIAERSRERSALAARLEPVHGVIKQREAIVRDFESLQDARKRREDAEPHVERFNRATSELQTAKGAIDMERTRLKGELSTAEAELRSAERAVAEIRGLEAKRTELSNAITAEAEVSAQLSALRGQVSAKQEDFAALKARNTQLQELLQEIDEVLELLARPHAACPVCESDLSGARQDAVVTKQRAKREAALAERETLRRNAAPRKNELAALQEQLAQVETRYNTIGAAREALAHTEAQIAALRPEVESAQARRSEAALLRDRLAREDFAGPQRAHQLKLQAELERLQLYRAEYETFTNKMRALQPAADRYQTLQQAEANLDRLVAEAQRVEALLAERKSELFREQERVARLKADLAGYATVVADQRAAEVELNRRRSEQSRLSGKEQAVCAAIARCERLIGDKQERQAAFRLLDEERKAYQQLAAAFGKKGVQALIIENVIPELEEEANALLDRMTDNGMQIRFQTTRAARTGSQEIETLDILIMDEAGQRPYELYSGGEAFRVNLATRIALSKLLARRSGARLQTLFLDEGFGTQDGKGREKLVEVIESIKDDFEKILVITHVEELKDAFAQRIEVVKDATGSKIHLL